MPDIIAPLAIMDCPADRIAAEADSTDLSWPLMLLITPDASFWARMMIDIRRDCSMTLS